MSRKKRKLKTPQAQEASSKGQQLNRRLSQGLLFSGALNIALATSLIYFAVKGKEETSPLTSQVLSVEKPLALDLSKEASLQTVLEDYSHLDFESLALLLKDPREVVQGFSQRDLALSTLVHFHDFDIHRALSGQSLNVSYLTFHTPKEEQVPLFNQTSDQTFKQILSFLKVEQWPFTSEGLFKKLTSGPADESLKKAFFLTKEFMLLEALYAPSGMSQDQLLALIQQGPWSLVQQFADSKPLVQNFSNTLRIKFLSQYLDYASQDAAKWILDLDPSYALTKLSDDQAVTLLGLLDKRTPLNENFVLHLALGERSGWVKQEACRLLYYYSNKDFVEPFNYQVALEFIAKEYNLSSQTALSEQKELEPILTQKSEPEPSSILFPIEEQVKQYYVVQKGDCLSKIAKMHDIDVRTLKRANHLDNDVIQVGMTLIIP